MKILYAAIFLFIFSSCTHQFAPLNPQARESLSLEEIDIAGQTLFALQFDAKEYPLSIVRAQNGRETVESICQRSKAKACINGGFFQADGTPAGVLKVNGNLIAYPAKTRGAFGFNRNGQQVFFDQLYKQEKNLLGVYLHDWSKVENIIGGTPLLIRDSKAIFDFSVEQTNERFLTHRFARTGICQLKSHKLAFFIISGSSSLQTAETYKSMGLSIDEFRNVMKNYGCINGLNLDGGGSSTMVINNEIINPLPLGQRAVSEALVIHSRL
ncbi:MAG: phosphodiester glycosidase family protein [Myxococcales bacterium]|nr:phosphodiester glycosidase family protein [Myxococcales bacterium]USN51279.1 MAG: phosphodiester glycosidase family protein [Myxococcales bacterium]